MAWSADSSVRPRSPGVASVVRVGVPPARRRLRCDADGLRGVEPTLEAADAAQRDGQVAVRAHRGGAPGGRAGQGRRVVLRGRARIGQAHRQVPQRHRHRGPPRAVLQPLRHVLRQPEGVRRVRHAIELQLELRLGQVHVELLSQPRSLRRRGQCTGRETQLGLRVVPASVDGGEDRALDGEPRAVQRVPRCRCAGQGGRQVPRAVHPARLPVGAKQSHRERRVRPRPPGEHALDPRRDEGGFVGRREPVQQLRARRDGHRVGAGQRGRRDGPPGVRKRARAGRRRDRRARRRDARRR